MVYITLGHFSFYTALFLYNFMVLIEYMQHINLFAI